VSMMNRLLIGFTLIAVITGVNVYNNQDKYSGKTVLDKYGFSLSYPSNMMLIEAGFPDYSSGASDFSGMVQGTSIVEERIEQVTVIWTVVQEYSTLDRELMKVVEDVNGDSNVTINYMSEVKTQERDDYNYCYVYFEAQQRGLNFNAILGITVVPWQPLRSNRGYVIGYVASEGVYTESGLREVYLSLLDSFIPVM
jgi:hypothetical protein